MRSKRLVRRDHRSRRASGAVLQVRGAAAETWCVGQVRDVLRADGIGAQVGQLNRLTTLDRLLVQTDELAMKTMQIDRE